MQVKSKDKVFPLVGATGGEELLAGHRRDVITLTMEAPFQEAAALFTEGASFTIVEDTGEEFIYDTHTAAGPITDNRDGTVTVKMGKAATREQDLEDQAAEAEAVTRTLVGRAVTKEEAKALRPVIELAAASLPDDQAAGVPSLFPAWSVGEAVTPGDRRYYDPTGRLYKCVQGHTTQADWTPDKTPALWAVVDAAHAGTKEDPIPAARGMEYEYGKYYSDPEDGKIYKCERIGEAAGGKITLQYLPHELIGNYFAAAA